MKKTGRPLWKKIMAFVCVLTVCVTAAQWPIGTARAAVDVKTIYLKVVDGYSWTDETYMNLMDVFNLLPEYKHESGEYTYTYEREQQRIKVVRQDGGKFVGPICNFYMLSSTSPTITADGANMGTISSEGGDKRKIPVVLLNATKDEITLTPVVEYNITPAPEVDTYFTYYAVDGRPKNKVTSGEDVKFRIVEKEPALYTLNFYRDVDGIRTLLKGERKKASGDPWDGTDFKEYAYTEYTVSQITANTTIVCTPLEKKFTATSTVVAGSRIKNVSVYPAKGIASYGDVTVNVSLEDGSELSPDASVKFTGGRGINQDEVTQEKAENSNSFILHNITDNIVITGITDVKIKQVQVVFEYNSNCTFKHEEREITEPALVNYNNSEPYQFTVTPAAGQEIVSVTQNGQLLSEDSTDAAGVRTYSLKNLTADSTTIRATTKTKTFKATLMCDGESKENRYDCDEYTVEVLTPEYSYNGNVEFTVIPKPGYEAPQVSVTSGERGISPAKDGNKYTCVRVSGDVTISVTKGAKEKYTITFNKPDSAGYSFQTAEGEPITETVKSVEAGTDYGFKVVVDSKYNQSKPVVNVNGITVSPRNDIYYTGPLTGNVVVDVSGVTINTYTVTLKSGDGYTLSSSASSSGITAGSEFTFNLSVKEGYGGTPTVKATDSKTETVEVRDNKDNTYTVTVNDNITVEVSGITLKKHKVTLQLSDTDQSNGKATIVQSSDETAYGEVEIPYGSPFSFKVKIGDGDEAYYRISRVTANGALVDGVGGTYTIQSVTSDINIILTTEKISLKVTYTDPIYSSKNSREATYTIDDMTEGKGSGRYLTLAAPESQSKVYRFGGWYSGEDKKEKIEAAELLGAPISLTARWEGIAGDPPNVNVTTKGSSSTDDQRRHVLIYSTNMDFSQIGDDEEYRSTVKITGYGTIYADKEFTPSQFGDTIAGRSKDNRLNSEKKLDLTLQDGHAITYYTDIDGKAVGDLGTSVGFMLTQYFTNPPAARWGAGWIELTVSNPSAEKDDVFIVVPGSAEKLDSSAARAAALEEDDSVLEENIAAPLDTQAPEAQDAENEAIIEETPVEIEQPAADNMPTDGQITQEVPVETPQESATETPADAGTAAAAS